MMEILILSHADIEKLLPMEDCIEVMAEALAALEKGEMYNPLRMAVRPPNAAGLMGLMPAYRGGPAACYGLKEVCVFPGNPERGLDAHQGSVLLHSGETGEIQAMLNGSAVTAIRTAAISGVATRLLAREDSGVLALIGAGVQAIWHLEAMNCVRKFHSLRIFDIRIERATRLAKAAKTKYPLAIEVVKSAEEAVNGADVVVTVTNSREPVLKRKWVRDGTHINAVGSSIPTARELDTALMTEGVLFVDRRESFLKESGDYLLAAKEGGIGPDHIRAEIGELLLKKREGRTTAEEITIFKSLGMAVEDLAAAQFVYKRALETSSGVRVPF